MLPLCIAHPILFLINHLFYQVFDKYGHLQPRICRKMDFPEIIMPGLFIIITIIEFKNYKSRENKKNTTVNHGLLAQGYIRKIRFSPLG